MGRRGGEGEGGGGGGGGAMKDTYFVLWAQKSSLKELDIRFWCLSKNDMFWYAMKGYNLFMTDAY